MPDLVYSIRIELERVKVIDPDDGDVYFIAEVDGRSRGRSSIFAMNAGDTADLRPLGWVWEKQVLGAPAAIPITIAAWDHDALSADDALGRVTTSVTAPWTAREVTVQSPDHNLELTYRIGVTVVTTTSAPVAVVSRQHDGSTYRSTLRPPNVAVAIIRDIEGLYKPGVDSRALRPAGTTRASGRLVGYTSEDDRGRVFINRKPDDTWEKGTQYIELTVVVEPASVRLPAGAKMVWSFEDPDDPSNEAPNVHPDAGRILDPNDYSGATKTAAAAGDNDPNGKKKATPRFEEIDPAYALSGSETLIDVATRTTKVRFHVSDIAGDNFRITAIVKADASLDAVLPAQTGCFTVWNRIDLEYVKMDSALELPVAQISDHYDMAFAQVDVSLKRVVTGASDLPAMGANQTSAYAMCDTYASSAGEFSKEGEKGWFFIVAANRFVPPRATHILYEGPAEAHGDHVRLPAGARLRAGTPAMLRVFDPARIVGVTAPKPNDHDIHFKIGIVRRTGRNLFLATHDFHLPEDPDNSFLDANLTDYGFTAGETIEVQVLDAGDEALVTGGISPGGVDIAGKHYFGGRLIVFTQSSPASEHLTILCHELCHAFDNAHKCGNWDWEAKASRTACCMCYWFQFVLDDASPRRPIRWTHNLAGPKLCAPHIRRMRDYHLEDNPGLGWGGP